MVDAAEPTIAPPGFSVEAAVLQALEQAPRPHLPIIRPSTIAWDGAADAPGIHRWAELATAPPMSWWRRALAWCWEIVRRYLGRQP